VLWILGEYQEAKLLHQEMLAMNRHIGDPAGIARALGNLGMDAMGLGELEEARQFLEESLALYKEISHLPGMRDELGDLSELAYVMGQHAKAARLAREAITVFCYADAMPSGLLDMIHPGLSFSLLLVYLVQPIAMPWVHSHVILSSASRISGLGALVHTSMTACPKT
jgi:hypothetical protein